MPLPRTFPAVLLQILSDKSNSDSIAWLHHGLAFSILNRQKLLQEVLPQYFKDKTKIKFTSFARKLKRWGFVRVPSGDDNPAYFNKHFRRENASLDQMRPDQEGESRKQMVPFEFTLRPCGYNAINSKRESRSAKKIVAERRPLKKRPVDASSLKVDGGGGNNASLPEPKVIQVLPKTRPSILESCSFHDIERQGLMNRNKKLNRGAYAARQHDRKQDLLLLYLLKRHLLREEKKAKRHYEQHYSRREYLLEQLQTKLHHLEQTRHPSSSPSLRNSGALVRNLLDACTSSSLTSSMVLSNEQPLDTSSCTYSIAPSHRHCHHQHDVPTNSASSRIIYGDYAHAA